VKRSAFVGVAGAGLLAGLPAAARGTAASEDAKYRPDVVYRRRVAAAAEARAKYQTSGANGDEARYAASGYLGSYAKGCGTARPPPSR
jgi:hypothetical protein